MIQHLNHRPKSIPPRHVPRDLPVLERAHGNPELLGGIGLGEPLALAPIFDRLAELFSRHDAHPTRLTQAKASALTAGLRSNDRPLRPQRAG